MLLLLPEHPSDGEHDALLADGVPVPTSVALLQPHIGGSEDHRACEVMDVEVEYQAPLHIHLAYAEIEVTGTLLPFVTCGHGRSPVAVKGERPILREIGRECSANVAVMAFHGKTCTGRGGIFSRS